MYQSITPNLMTHDIISTIEFYKTILDFDVIDQNENEFVILSKEQVTIMFQQTSSLMNEYPILEAETFFPCLSLFIQVSDINKLYLKLKDCPNILKELSKTWYGVDEFALKDNNGYVLTFAQRQ